MERTVTSVEPNFYDLGFHFGSRLDSCEDSNLRKMKMEISTDKIIEEIDRDGEQDEVLKIIKAQALEIRELQAVIVRLRDESQKNTKEIT